jgi:hypothetical protein
MRPALIGDANSGTQLAVIDHLVERLRQARAGEFNVPVLDVADRLHAESYNQNLWIAHLIESAAYLPS